MSTDTAPRTLEQRLKFDHGLPVGRSVIEFINGDKSVRALVEITARGVVSVITKPAESDMHSSWWRVRGDKAEIGKGSVIVWAARNPEVMAMFDGDVVARVPVSR